MLDVNDVKEVIEKGTLEQISALLDKFPELVNHTFDGSENTPEATSPLLMAISTAGIEKVKLLLKHGADAHQQPVNVVEWYLQELGWHDDLKLTLLRLFVKLKVKVSATFDIPPRVITNVYQQDKISAFDLLVKLGFDPVEEDKKHKLYTLRGSSCSYSIEMALIGANWEGTTRIASKLLALGCKAEVYGSYYTIMDRALAVSAYSFMEELLDANVAPEFGRGLLEEIINEHRKMPTALRDRLLGDETDFKKVDRDGDNYIHLAIYNKNQSIVPFFIEKGVDINAKNKAGKTAVHLSVDNNFKTGIKGLIKLGADLNLTNNKGKTPLDLALLVNGFKNITDLMIEAGAKTSLQLSGKSFDSNDSTSTNLLLKESVAVGEVWAETFLDSLEKLPAEKLTAWHGFVRLGLENNSTKPSRKWLRDANRLIEEIGADSFRQMMCLLFPLVKEMRTKVIRYDHELDNHREAGRKEFISDSNTRILKGMLWACVRFNDSEMCRIVRNLAGEMYKKVYYVGMRNAKLGNAALHTLSKMQDGAGVKEVAILRASTKYSSALYNINKVFDQIAKELDQTPDELAAISIPDYDLTDIAYYETTIGGFAAQVKLVATGKTELLWVKGEKTQKTLPAELKKKKPEEVKALKEKIKELQVASRAHSLRIEQQYLKQTLIDFSSWQENYVDHKLVGFMARRLIWRVSAKRKHTDVIFSQAAGGYVDAQNNKVALSPSANVILWHPSMSSAEEVLAWRTWLIENEITQPFKQAHREVYFLTDAERATEDHSLRFANHILLHGQFNALAAQRGWSQNKGGRWDGGSENSANKTIQGYDVEFDAQGLDQYGYTGNGIYSCVATSTVRFKKKYKAVKLDKIDPLFFSEVMRDIDLFVGVSSVGNDPDWADRENNDYWQGTSFGALSESAKTRFDVLSALIPKLKIAAQLSLEGRFLKVAGKLCTYKIHLGSANILMEPNDSYLCIVGAREKKVVMLPFEGDKTLSMILSKAMLLANDDKIKDQTILSQINKMEAV